MDTYALSFSVSNLGPKSFQKLLNKFGTAQKAWAGTEREYKEIGITGLTYEKFEKFRKEFDSVQYTGRLKDAHVGFVSFSDKAYPAGLKKLENPPIGLFCKGNLALLRHSADEVMEFFSSESRSMDSGSEAGMTVEGVVKIAVVGTRKVTAYGKEVTELLVAELVHKSSACIISGLALGVDGIAHRTAIENKGSTIAVLGCGVDCCLPSENYSIYTSILENGGLIVSEYPLSQLPNKGTFPARNRIIAALSDGILVTQAAEGSGSLITAVWGYKLGKKVFAVPGQINSHTSKGGLELIKKGAKLVTNADDILSEFNPPAGGAKFKSESKNNKGLNSEEKKIILILESEEMGIDALALKTKTDVGSLMGNISVLELKGIVRNTRGKISLIM